MTGAEHLAWAFAQQYPDRLNKVVALNAPPRQPTDPSAGHQPGSEGSIALYVVNALGRGARLDDSGWRSEPLAAGLRPVSGSTPLHDRA